MVGKGKFIVSTLFSFSEREKLNRERERIQKAKWRASKLETDPTYCDKVQKYDRERKRKTSRNGDKITSLRGEGITSWKILSTPTKKSKPPSYYKVLSTSKKVQQLLSPSPNTHTTILKNVLSKAVKSPWKSKCMGKEFTSPPKRLHDASEGIGWETLEKNCNTEESEEVQGSKGGSYITEVKIQSGRNSSIIGRKDSVSL